MSDVVNSRFLKDYSFQYLVTTSGLGRIWSNKNQKLKHSKMLCCLHTFGTRSALWSQLHFPQPGLSPPTAPDATFLGNTPPLFHRYCLAFVSSPTFANISRSSPPTSLSLSSLALLHFHGAAQYSRVSIATLADMQQVSVSRGTRFSSLPLATQPVSPGPDWLARSSGLMVFTEMRS